jgi:YidC/Oxa1 family membrane protein insertase
MLTCVLIVRLRARWATIVVFTILARAAVLPLTLGGLRAGVIMEQLGPELKQYQDAAKATTDQQTKALLMGKTKALMNRHGIGFFSALKAPLISMPIFFGTFWGIQAMCRLPVWQLKVQGIGWIQDLTLADPHWILPFTSAVATWCIIHVRCLHLKQAGLIEPC